MKWLLVAIVVVIVLFLTLLVLVAIAATSLQKEFDINYGNSEEELNG